MGLVDSLLNLYRVDSQVRGLRARLHSAERYLAAQNKQLNDLMQQEQELVTRRKQMQATIANLEVETKAIDERLEKLRNELNNAATTKLHAALLSELNVVKESKVKIEDRELADIEQLETIQKQIDALEPQKAERIKVRDLAQAQLTERQNDVGHRLTELEADRAKAAAVVPPEALAMFEDVADDFEDGDCMAAIEQVGRREFACGACNISIPLQISLGALTGDSVTRCQSCGRILYMQEETRGSLAKK